MALPENIAKIKIHPAIGFARLSTNPDIFTFGDPITQYKSNNLIKRQAVQFRLFSYDASGKGLEELTPARLHSLGLSVVWKANVANLKIARQRDDSYAIRAVASSDDANQGKLVGKCGDFAEGQQISLGQIRADGRFIPPLAGAFRQDASVPIPDYGSLHSDSVTDNTCDGQIRAEITDTHGNAISVPVLSAWVVVAPPDFAPDWDDDPSDPPHSKSLLQSLQLLLSLPDNPPATAVNATARDLDRQVLQRGTGEFAPGIEINPLAATMFENASITGDADEVRVRLDTDGAGGAKPGGMTFGLCSPWQYDFRACSCSFWPNHRPDVAQKGVATGPRVDWRRKQHNDTSSSAPAIETCPEYIQHVDKLGIIRKEAGKRVEKERNNDI